MHVADHAASRYLHADEHGALAIAIELLGDDDERTAALHERATRAAILASLPAATGLDHARLALDAVGRRDGPAAAARLAVQLGRLAHRVEMNAGWTFGRLARPYSTALDLNSADAVQLLAWEVEENEFLDPANPEIAEDTPERARLNASAQLLPSHQRPSEPTFVLRPPQWPRTTTPVCGAWRSGWRTWARDDIARQRWCCGQRSTTSPPLVRCPQRCSC